MNGSSSRQDKIYGSNGKCSSESYSCSCLYDQEEGSVSDISASEQN